MRSSMQARLRWVGGAAGQRHGSNWMRGLRTSLCLAGMAAVAGAAHSGQQTPANPCKPIHPEVLTAPPDANQQMLMREQQEEQKKGDASYAAANGERKKQITDDSAKLLKLATELKTEVDKSNKDTLSLSVIHKADEIEKLAHSVKEKMKLTLSQN
jgi:hypothetical protein